MPTKLKGTVEQLKSVVEMTGASGEWQDKGNGHWQFRANDGAILNWWQSSGTLSFQGPQQEKQEFEQIVQLAIAKLLREGAGPAAPHELPPMDPLPIGRYRHYKGNEYEVLGVAGTVRRWRNWSCTELSTATTACGSAREPCSWNESPSRASWSRGSSTWDRDRVDAAAESAAPLLSAITGAATCGLPRLANG